MQGDAFRNWLNEPISKRHFPFAPCQCWGIPPSKRALFANILIYMWLKPAVITYNIKNRQKRPFWCSCEVIWAGRSACDVSRCATGDKLLCHHKSLSPRSIHVLWIDLAFFATVERHGIALCTLECTSKGGHRRSRFWLAKPCPQRATPWGACWVRIFFGRRNQLLFLWLGTVFIYFL